MQPERDTRAGRIGRAALLGCVSLALAIVMTWPLVTGLGSLGRTGAKLTSNGHFGDNGDGLFSLWNVSWVARTVVADPVNLFEANIFYPHHNSLAYSEANLFAGVVGMPVWWLTKNPYATLNVVILFAFATAFLCAWLLAWHLTRDRAAATVAALCYAFCPYVFSHTAHVQLMLTGGIPLAMLMLHRLADAPSIRRGLALGAALFAQALACAYYGIFAALMAGFGVIFFTISRGLARERTWWTGVGAGAILSIAAVVPFIFPFLAIQQEEGFSRTLQDAVRYSANATSYLTSSAPAHRWLRDATATWPRYVEVMFPGIVVTVFAAAGAALALTRRPGGVPRERETALLYGLLGILAFWASFGPEGGLYRLLYYIPMFSFLRAPSRMGIVVVLCFAALAALALKRSFGVATGPRRTLATAATIGLVMTELAIFPFPWERALVPPTPYRVLATLPREPLAEFPFYGGRVAWHLHTQYMIYSTIHWMPMMNGYSDHTPAQFRTDSFILDSFPSHDSFRVLQKARVRYIGIHWDMFGPRAEEIRRRLEPYAANVRALASDERMTLYEIVSFP
jgi:hypothetical protein